MTLAVLIIFLLLTILAEYSIARNDLPKIRRSFWRKIYAAVTIVQWSIAIAMFVIVAFFSDIPPKAFRCLEAVLPAFFFMCSSKIVFAVFSWLGRFTRQPNIFYSVGLVAVLIMNCLMTYASTTAITSIEVERVDMVSAHIPKSLDGFRLVVFSDIHAATLLKREKVLRNMVDIINGLDADMVINCGDLISEEYRELTPELLGILSGIESDYGVFSGAGSGEMGKFITDPDLTAGENLRQVARMQESMGWKLLVDTTVYVNIGDERMGVTGISYPQELMNKKKSAKPTVHMDYSYLYEDKNPGEMNLTISNNPLTWDDILATGQSTITLSGHVQSMQIRIKTGRKKYWSPAARVYKYWGGLYENDDRYLYVNNGIGYPIIPMKFGVKPEVTLIEFRRCGQ